MWLPLSLLSAIGGIGKCNILHDSAVAFHISLSVVLLLNLLPAFPCNLDLCTFNVKGSGSLQGPWAAGPHSAVAGWQGPLPGSGSNRGLSQAHLKTCSRHATKETAEGDSRQWQGHVK